MGLQTRDRIFKTAGTLDSRCIRPVWFFTTNPEYFSHNQFSPGINTQSQTPIGAFEGHLSYDFKPRLWVSLDGNYWAGGSTSLNGVPTPNTLESNSRVGVTASVPVSKHQSLKFSFSDGAYIRYGGNYRNFSVGWQYLAGKAEVGPAASTLP